MRGDGRQVGVVIRQDCDGWGEKNTLMKSYENLSGTFKMMKVMRENHVEVNCEKCATVTVQEGCWEGEEDAEKVLK